MKIFVTGASGLVGKRLVVALASRGNRVLALSRKSGASGPSGAEAVHGDPSVVGPWLDRLDECDAVVHLAGENIFAERWSDKFMAEIRRSRVESTAPIAERLAKRPTRSDGTPKTLISASAVGYYGPGEDEKTESSPAGNDFMAEVCVAWEAAAEPARRAGVRVTHPRFGIVLDPDGGALPNLMRPFRFFVGGRVGHGRQWVSWIHRDDATSALLFLLDQPLSGPVNVTAPNPVRNREFSSILAAAMHRPNWLPVPPFSLRLALGKVAEVITTGQRVVPKALSETGFEFRYARLEKAMGQLIYTARGPK